MKKEEQQPVGLIAKYREPAFRRWRVFSTFATGVLIGLFYVLLISKQVLSIVGDEGHRPLVLIFSGILGGVIYTILVDGHVEMPRFIENGNKFEAGLFGDILLGIAGAIVLAFIAEETFGMSFPEPVELAAVGLVGGYGGRAILQFALNRVFKDINVLQADREKTLKAAYQRRLERLDGLQVIEGVNRQVRTGLSSSELDELSLEIRQAPASVRNQVFDAAKEGRRTANLSGETDRVERTIPIFKALIEAEPKRHAYYAQLAYAYKDSDSPDGLAALRYLAQAIELRGDQHHAQTWKYELSRAILQIQQSHQAKNSYDFDVQTENQIIQDLLTVAEIYNLENLLRAAKHRRIPVPIFNWVRHNQADLIAREETTALALKLIPLLEEETQPTGGSRTISGSGALAVTPRLGGEGANSSGIDITITSRPQAIQKTNRKIDRDIFFKHYRSRFKIGSLSQNQVESFDAIFDYWDKSPHMDLRWLAYALATAFHETGGRMTPVREGFAKSDAAAIRAVEKLLATGRINWNYAKAEANGNSYFGRGFVQITHGENYLKLGQAMGMGTKLYDEPSLALDRNISVEILFKGMVDGLYVAGHKLGVYFNQSTEDWYGARTMINADKGYKPGWAHGVSIGQMVADHGRQFYGCCQAAAIAQSPSSSSSPSSGLSEAGRARPEAEGDWMEAVRDTWLKRSPDPVDSLSPAYKKRCVAGTRYEVASYQKDQNDHYLVTLAHGAGDWYIFDSKEEDHWDTTWENDHGEAGESGSAAVAARLDLTRIEVKDKQPVGDKLTPDMPFDTLITPHVTYGELAKYQDARRFVEAHQCKTAYELCVFLEKCRKHFGDKPLVITSGHRPPQINWEQRGAKTSEHLYDAPSKGAVDFYIPAVSEYELQNWCLGHYPFSVGKGAYRGFVHLGIRPDRRQRAWPY